MYKYYKNTNIDEKYKFKYTKIQKKYLKDKKYKKI